MPDMVRAFVAFPVEASPSLRNLLRQLNALGREVKSINPDQLHVTLKFLGDIPWTSISEVSGIVEDVVASQAIVSADIQKVGAFPDLKRPRVVWTGLTPREPLSTIAGELNERLGQLGFPREQRGFVPHVTLARIRSRPPAGLRPLLESSADLAFGGVQVDRVLLYQSSLGKGGSKYTVLSQHELK